MRIRTLLGAVAAAALLCSCTTVDMQLSVVAPRGLDSREIDLERLDEGVSVVGYDHASAVFLFPLSTLDFQSAVDDALGGRKDAVLVDVTVERTAWWAVLYGEGRLAVRGIMVPLPVRDEAESR